MHRAGTRIGAAHGVARARGGNQLALGGLGTKALGGNGYPAAQRDAVLVLKNIVHHRYGFGPCGHGDGICRTEFLHAAMPQCRHPVHPLQHGWRGLKDVGHHRYTLACEPQGVVGGKVGHAGLGAKREIVLFHHVRQAPQIRAVGRRGIGRAQALHAGAHLAAVFPKGLGRLGRHIGKKCLRAARLQVVGHGGPEQRGVGPLRKHPRHTLEVGRIQHRLGVLVFEHLADQGRVAIDVGTDLQKGRLAITTGEGQHIGLGRDAGDDHRLPGQLLETQHQPDFFGKRR